jgi:hypothetical protein
VKKSHAFLIFAPFSHGGLEKQKSNQPSLSHDGIVAFPFPKDLIETTKGKASRQVSD